MSHHSQRHIIVEWIKGLSEIRGRPILQCQKLHVVEEGI